MNDFGHIVELLRVRASAQGADVGYRFLLKGDARGPTEELTWGELDRRARRIAAWLQLQRGEGRRALLLYRPGHDFIAAFFGCLYAGTIAVPVSPPASMTLERSLPRLLAIVGDCDAAFVLT